MEISIISVIVGSVVYFGVGALWYSVLFGKPWQKLKGISDGETQNEMKAMGISLLGTIVNVVAIHLLLEVARPQNWAAALVYGLLLGVPVIMTGLNNTVYGKDEEVGDRARLNLIDFSYPFVAITLVSLIAFFLK